MLWVIINIIAGIGISVLCINDFYNGNIVIGIIEGFFASCVFSIAWISYVLEKMFRINRDIYRQIEEELNILKENDNEQ